MKRPLVLPIAVGLLNPNGDEVVRPTTVLEMTQGKQSFAFPGLASRPVPSSQLSAPVVLDRKASPERARLPAGPRHRPLHREGGRALAKDMLARVVTEAATPGPDWLDALAGVALDDSSRSRRSGRWRCGCRAMTTWPRRSAAGVVPDPDAIPRRPPPRQPRWPSGWRRSCPA